MNAVRGAMTARSSASARDGPCTRVEGAERPDRENLMLILTRKVGEEIRIGEDVTVKVLGVRSGQVKIGIQAPRDLPVHRQEIFERITSEGSRHPAEDPDSACPRSACGD